MAAEAFALALPQLDAGADIVEVAPEARTRSGLIIPAVTYLVREKRWRLEEPWQCQVGESVITIPEGTTNNLASIPRILWPIAASFELGICGPTLHDPLYEYGGRLPRAWMAPWRPISRAEADGWFRYLMDDEGVEEHLERAAYAAVRGVGSLYWRD